LLSALIVIIAFMVLADIAASFYFYNKAVVRNAKAFLAKTPDLRSDQPFLAPETQAWIEAQSFREVEIVSDDGLKLRGYYLEAGAPAAHTVILAHGYSGHAKQMGAFAKYYHEQLGFNVLMPDHRGHGRSEGNVIGFGWLERRDYLKWIDYIVGHAGDRSAIILHGVSMGAATVLMASGEPLPDQVKAVIADSSYTSAKDELGYQLQRMYRLPRFPLLQSTSLLTKIRAGYAFDEASALVQVRKARVPILFIHGAADRFVPCKMVHTLYENCRSEKELLIVENAGHGKSYQVDQTTYQRTMTAFIGKYMRTEAAVL